MLLAAAVAAIQPLPSPDPSIGRTAWVLSTIEQSEWCPAGNVRLDLGTGRYELTPRAPRPVCNQAPLERPVTTGRLAPKRLSQVRAAYMQVLRQGPEDPICRDGGRQARVVISNGGPQILVVARGSGIASAPDELGCWSEAAEALHDMLDEMFRSASPRSR